MKARQCSLCLNPETQTGSWHKLPTADAAGPFLFHIKMLCAIKYSLQPNGRSYVICSHIFVMGNSIQNSHTVQIIQRDPKVISWLQILL